MKSTYCEYILEKMLSTSEVGPILALIAPSPLKIVKNKFGEFFSPVGLGIHVCTYRSTLPATFFGGTNMILYFCNFWYFLQTHETQGFLVEVISSNVLVSPSWLGLTVSECLCYKWQLICSFVVVAILFFLIVLMILM
jgi:hypothetical protein